MVFYLFLRVVIWKLFCTAMKTIPFSRFLVLLVLQYYWNCFSEKPFWLFWFIFCANFYCQIGHFSDQTKHLVHGNFKISYVFNETDFLNNLWLWQAESKEKSFSFYWELILLFFVLQRLATTNQLSRKWNPANLIGWIKQ